MCMFSTLHITKSIGLYIYMYILETKSTNFKMYFKTANNLEITRALLFIDILLLICLQGIVSLLHGYMTFNSLL
jgi:hypothetical protein